VYFCLLAAWLPRTQLAFLRVSLPTCPIAMLQEPEKVADVITEAAKGSLKAATKP
jgi:hypothetical protein